MDRPVVSGAPVKGRERRSGRDLQLQNIIIVVLAVAFWAGALYGGYYLVAQQVDRSVKAVQQSNALNVKALESRLDALAAEVQKMGSSLSSADRTLSSSGSTQKELNDKIQKLDGQLKELEKSLKILKEAPNAPR